MPKYAIGVDYGTSSCRALIVDLADGSEVATAVYAFNGGEDGVITDANDPNLARQFPSEYRQGFITTVKQALAESGIQSEEVVGIGTDATGSTPIPLDQDGRPPAEKFPNDPSAMAWLWKDHTAHAEAAEITALAEKRGEPFLTKCGGAYSSEWFWSKILHCTRTAPEVQDAAATWIECSDYIPALITGTLGHPTRNICAAGHKGMWNPGWGGWPSGEFLTLLDPQLARIRATLDEPVPTSTKIGGLSAEFARGTGLGEGTPVAAGILDAHSGAVGSGIRAGVMVKIMGTSQCDCFVVPPGQGIADIPGVAGIVPGSILPDRVGIEAGQSAVGDLFGWFVHHLAPAGQSHAELTEAASQLRPGESGLLALDWNNGNRTILADPRLTGLILGQTLRTTAAEVYRALIEATAFGSRVILNRVEEYGLEVSEIIACGGIPERSPLVMQIYADICRRPIRVSRSAQSPALGAAIFGAVAGGAFPDVDAAVTALTSTKPDPYLPDPARADVYDRLFAEYHLLHDALGGVASGDLGGLMKRLMDLRDEVRTTEFQK